MYDTTLIEVLMKKRFAAGLALLMMIITVMGCGQEGGIDNQAALRAYDPNDTTVYIVDEGTALIGSIYDASMTEEEIQRSAELRAMAVTAFELCNAERVKAGLPAYAWSDDLAAAAMVRATEIVGTFSHTRPDGTDYWTVNGNIIYGENLARYFNSAEGCVNGWMNSITHKANILDNSLRTVGIAIYEDTDGRLYWAQEFGY